VNVEDLVWRSQLYVPSNNQRFIAKAHTYGADTIILDLEDSVPIEERPYARSGLVEAVESVGQNGADVTVRINSPLLETYADIEAAVMPGLSAVYVTKVTDGEYLKAVSDKIGQRERATGMDEGCIHIIAIIETSKAYLRAEEIACADSRTIALVLGGEDLALDLGSVPDDETLAMPRQHIAIVARSAGLVPFGIMGSIADYKDLNAIRVVAERSRRFGFEGAACIHPSVVPVLNEAFTPSAIEVEHATRAVERYGNAETEGLGAITVDGKMIDVPVVRRAKNLLKRYELIKRRY